MNENIDNQIDELEAIELFTEDEETTEAEETEETEEAELTDEEEVIEESTSEEPESEEEVENPTDESDLESTDSIGELEVKYLKETKKLKDIDKEELTSLIQKGFNHDRIKEKYDKIKEVSELFKMSDSELIDSLYTQYFDAEADRRGVSTDKVKADYESSKKTSEQIMYANFLENFPDVKADAIPVDVWAKVKSGEDLTVAYRQHQLAENVKGKETELSQLQKRISELESKLKTKAQNEATKKKAVVKPTTNNGSEENVADDFLQGLLG